MSSDQVDVVVIGAGPAGVIAALRAAELGARTEQLARGAFGGMAANDGPVPVRTLAHAARLVRGAREFARYGIAAVEPRVDYERLLARVREVIAGVRDHSRLRARADQLGIIVHERVGNARFRDPHTVAAESGLCLSADRIILCAGGMARRLNVPGAELTA